MSDPRFSIYYNFGIAFMTKNSDWIHYNIPIKLEKPFQYRSDLNKFNKHVMKTESLLEIVEDILFLTEK